MHRTHRTQSPGQESQDTTLLYLMQATFLLMLDVYNSGGYGFSIGLVSIKFYCFIMWRSAGFSFVFRVFRP